MTVAKYQYSETQLQSIVKITIPHDVLAHLWMSTNNIESKNSITTETTYQLKFPYDFLQYDQSYRGKKKNYTSKPDKLRPQKSQECNSSH